MSLLRTMRRRNEVRPDPIERSRAIVRGYTDEQLGRALHRPPKVIRGNTWAWTCAVNDELVSREALSNARRKLAIRDRDRPERPTYPEEASP